MFTYLDAFHPDEAYVRGLKEHYQSGGLGDGTTKKILEECLQELLAPIRTQRAEYLNDKGLLLDILRKGSEVSREKSESVLYDVKEAFGLNLF